MQSHNYVISTFISFTFEVSFHFITSPTSSRFLRFLTFIFQSICYICFLALGDLFNTFLQNVSYIISFYPRWFSYNLLPGSVIIFHLTSSSHNGLYHHRCLVQQRRDSGPHSHKNTQKPKLSPTLHISCRFSGFISW